MNSDNWSAKACDAVQAGGNTGGLDSILILVIILQRVGLDVDTLLGFDALKPYLITHK